MIGVKMRLSRGVAISGGRTRHPHDEAAAADGTTAPFFGGTAGWRGVFRHRSRITCWTGADNGSGRGGSGGEAMVIFSADVLS